MEEISDKPRISATWIQEMSDKPRISTTWIEEMSDKPRIYTTWIHPWFIINLLYPCGVY